MDTMHVQPGKSIGPLILGMHRTEIEAELQKLHLALGGQNEMLVREYPSRGAESYHVRYIVGAPKIFFMVDYTTDGRSVSISVHRDAIPELYGLDVSRTEAEPLMEMLKQYDTCVFDDPDEQLSTQYTFPTIGVRLWRERAFHRKLLENAAWMEEMSEVLEDEYEYLYFELVTVFVPEYGELLCYM